MRRRATIASAVTVAAVVAVGVLVAVLTLAHQPGGKGPQAAALSVGGAPAGASAAVRLLVSERGRSVLTPELRAVLPAGRLFPAGTTFVPRPGTWHRAGEYANLTGTLREPGHRGRSAEVGLVNRHGHWLVTFEASP